MRKKVLIIANPCSGKCKSKKVIGFITKEFALAGYITTVCFTECMGDAERLARENANGQDLVVCIGGDGTLNEVLNGITDFDRVRLGVIPTGSGNDFGRNLKLPKSSKESLKQICASIRKDQRGEELYRIDLIYDAFFPPSFFHCKNLLK